MSARMKGTVKWFNANRGFGFIQPEQGKDVFVHIYALQGKQKVPLVEGQRVEFTMAEGKKGPQADNVIILDNQ